MNTRAHTTRVFKITTMAELWDMGLQGKHPSSQPMLTFKITTTMHERIARMRWIEVDGDRHKSRQTSPPLSVVEKRHTNKYTLQSNIECTRGTDHSSLASTPNEKVDTIAQEGANKNQKAHCSFHGGYRVHASHF